MSLPDTPKTDVQEHGANQQVSDRRLFMQLHVFGGCLDAKAPLRALESSRFEAVLYQDANDPRGIAVLAMNEDPTFFVSGLRELLNADLVVAENLQIDERIELPQPLHEVVGERIVVVDQYDHG